MASLKQLATSSKVNNSLMFQFTFFQECVIFLAAFLIQKFLHRQNIAEVNRVEQLCGTCRQ